MIQATTISRRKADH